MAVSVSACSLLSIGQEIMEAIWVAAEMRAGAASAHSAIAIDALNQELAKPGGD